MGLEEFIYGPGQFMLYGLALQIGKMLVFVGIPALLLSFGVIGILRNSEGAFRVVCWLLAIPLIWAPVSMISAAYVGLGWFGPWFFGTLIACGVWQAQAEIRYSSHKSKMERARRHYHDRVHSPSPYEGWKL